MIDSEISFYQNQRNGTDKRIFSVRKKRRIAMGTNYYFMSRNKELMQVYFAEKSEWGVLGGV